MQEDISNTYSNAWSNWQQPGPSIPQEALSVPSAYQQPPPEFFASMPVASGPSGSQQSVVNVLASDVKSDSPENTQLMDMGMMVSGESGMDEQWMSFMRESGLMDPNTYASSQSNNSGSTNAACVGNRIPSQVVFR